MNYPLFPHIAFVVPLSDVLGIANLCINAQGEVRGSPLALEISRCKRALGEALGWRLCSLLIMFCVCFMSDIK